MSITAGRRCIDCNTSIDPNAPSHATRCQPCHKKRPRTCIDCGGSIDNNSPDYANRCYDCFSRTTSRRCHSCKKAIPKNAARGVVQCYECMLANKSTVAKRSCDNCGAKLPDTVPKEMTACYTCIGKRATRRHCQDCKSVLPVELPLDLDCCYECLGKREYAKRRCEDCDTVLPDAIPKTAKVCYTCMGKRITSQVSITPIKVAEQLSAPQRVCAQCQKALTGTTATVCSTCRPKNKERVKPKLAKPDPNMERLCVDCEAPISKDAPFYAKQCYDCFCAVCERTCIDCKGPIPNNAPENATRCYPCKGMMIQKARSFLESRQQHGDSSEKVPSNHSRNVGINGHNGQDYPSDDNKERHSKSGADQSGWKVKTNKKRSPERKEDDRPTAEEKEMSEMVGQITEELAGL